MQPFVKSGCFKNNAETTLTRGLKPWKKRRDKPFYLERGLLDPQTFAAKSEPKDLFQLVRKFVKKPILQMNRLLFSASCSI